MNVIVTPSLYNVSVGPLPNLLVSGTGIVNLGPYLTTGYADTRYYLATNPSGFSTGNFTGIQYITSSAGSHTLSGNALLASYLSYDSSFGRFVYLGTPSDTQIAITNSVGSVNINTFNAGNGFNVSTQEVKFLDQNDGHTFFNYSYTGSRFLLYGLDSNITIDVANRMAYNEAQTGVLDWDNQLTIDSSGHTSIDWNNRVLSGNWNATNLTINGATISGGGGIGTGAFVLSLVQSSGNITGSQILGASPFYVFTGNSATWTLPSIASTIGRLYFIKNRGNSLTVAASGSDMVFVDASYPSYNIGAGQGNIFANDGNFWNVM